MAQFGWAYVNCSSSASSGGQAAGPTGSIQFLTGANATSGSAYLLYHTAAYGGFPPSTMVLSGSMHITGNLVVTGTVTSQEFIGDLEGAIRFDATNDEGDQITRGQVVYIKGVSGQTPTVGLAACDDSNKMPAFGLAAETAADGASLQIVTMGSINNLNLTSLYGKTFSEGDTVYVETGSGGTSGSLTNVAPTGSGNLLQNMGMIIRNGGGGDGQIKVGGAGRTNATPNLDKGYIFIGNDSNQSVQDDTVFVSSSANRVGINTTTLTHTLTVAGDISASVNVSASAFYGDGSNLDGVGGGTPVGSNTQIQYNADGAFGADSDFTWTSGSNTLTVTGDISASINISASDFYGGGANLTSLNASNVSAGTLDNARLPATISVTNVTASSLVSASFLYGDGSNLTNVGTATSAVLHSSSFTASVTSDILAINSSGSVITASLLAANSYDAGYRLSFKDVQGHAATNNILIKPSGSENIDGSTSGILITTNYGAVEIFSNGVNSYHILSTN